MDDSGIIGVKSSRDTVERITIRAANKSVECRVFSDANCWFGVGGVDQNDDWWPLKSVMHTKRVPTFFVTQRPAIKDDRSWVGVVKMGIGRRVPIKSSSTERTRKMSDRTD